MDLFISQICEVSSFHSRSITGQLLWRRRRPHGTVVRIFSKFPDKQYRLDHRPWRSSDIIWLEEAELSRLFLENLKVILLLDESERPVVIG